ncbi:MAG: hypothetical protein WA816_00720 [Bacteroidales bacterium]
MYSKIFFISVLVCFTSAYSSAQETPVKSDSTHIYKDIETYSKRNKFNTFMYRLIFKPITIISKKEVKKKAYKKLIQKPYSIFQGKIIRKIDIVTLDPFGYSATDTTSTEQTRLTNIGNYLHIKTRIIAIRNLLLIHKNELFNSFYVKESERLIRTQKFVHDVFFYVASSGPKSDSVDIFIRELDNWSIAGEAAISTSHTTIGLSDNNFLGTGHEFQNVFSRNISAGISKFSTNYLIPNIMTTYINSNLHYEVDGYGNIRRSLAVDRPFYSPYAKWAGGISFATQVKRDSLAGMNPLYVPINLKFKTQDFWAGKAIQIFKGSTEDELATNLILSARYLRIRYLQKPNDINDPLQMYSNEDFYLTGIGISTRKYVQDKYIFKYGTIEDVPVGKIIELTGGYQLRNSSWRPYLGMRFSFGNYNEWGYLSTNFEYGTFFRASHTEQSVITIGVNYFTGLFEIGNWRFRQFVKPQVTIGINRFSYDTLTLNDDRGINGFNSRGLVGTNRLLFMLQTQSYAPWNFFGFHFGPFLVYSAGMLGDAISGFKNRKLYSQIGFGVLIKNENLVFGTFQISLSFFPLIPGNGQNIFKMNSFSTNDFGFRDFVIGEPAPVLYR